MERQTALTNCPPYAAVERIGALAASSKLSLVSAMLSHTAPRWNSHFPSPGVSEEQAATARDVDRDTAAEAESCPSWQS